MNPVDDNAESRGWRRPESRFSEVQGTGRIVGAMRIRTYNTGDCLIDRRTAVSQFGVVVGAVEKEGILAQSRADDGEMRVGEAQSVVASPSVSLINWVVHCCAVPIKES